MRSVVTEFIWRLRWPIAVAVLLAFMLGLRAGFESRRISDQDRQIKVLTARIASLEKDLAREWGDNSVSAPEYAAMRQAAKEHEHKIDLARKISDDAIAECNREGNLAVDGLDQFIGGRVVCLRPEGGVVFVAEPHWPEE